MCVIIGFSTPQEWKDVEQIIVSAMAQNADGAGLAWLDGNSVRWIKGIFRVKQVRRLWNLAAGCWPRLFHARIATAGSTLPELCHPFPITRNAGTALSGRARAVLAHNGHISGLELARYVGRAMGHKFDEKEWSDSRLLAWLTYRIGSDFLSTFSAQKVAILDREGIHYYGNPWTTYQSAEFSNGGPIPAYDVPLGGYNANRWSHRKAWEDSEYWEGYCGSRYAKGWSRPSEVARRTNDMLSKKFYRADGRVYVCGADGVYREEPSTSFPIVSSPTIPSSVPDVLSPSERDELNRRGAVIFPSDENGS